MKCIKSKTGKIERVSDNKAIRLVSSGEWQYCSKHEYKEFIRFIDKLVKDFKPN